MVNKKFWATTFTLSGTIIGAGILGLPYIFAKSGFLVGIFWLIIIGAIMTFTNLLLAEITLKTPGNHQLTGYAKKHLGKWAGRLMLAAILFGIYSALLAYLIGEGESLSRLISPNTSPLICALIFWLALTLLLREGLRGLKKIETWGVIIIISTVIGIFVKFLPNITPQNLTAINPSYITSPIGVIMFALLGFIAIPELRKEIRGQEHLLKKAVIIGGTIPIILYALFCAVFVGILGKEVTQVATLSFGPLVTILGIFTMLTAYLSLSFALKDTFKTDLKFPKTKTFILTSLVPLILYILIEHFKIITFTSILGIGGAISAGITAILILLIAKKVKSGKTKIKPKFQMPINWVIIIILSTFFIISIILEFIS